MTPKEKAKELFVKYSGNTVHYESTKQCALIAVDEIIKEIYLDQYYSQKRITYYEAVKQEIEKL